MAKKFYITTPIYYPNDIPHIGHAYTTIAADVIARWKKQKGNDVFFLTGTDDHGKKIAEAAREAGKSPKDFTDELIPKFKDAWNRLDIEYDRFIRTTDKDHEQLVKEILQKVYDKGDIYKGKYEGLYCIYCEAYYTEKELEEGNCPIHKKLVEKLKEETYFFRLSKYKKELLKLYDQHPKFISPKHRKQEIINRVKEGLKDLSISRTSFDWGIPLPFDKKHICYVWFDALFNYYSATRKKGFEKFWPCDLHVIGKDILWFHTVYWPAFLMSAGLKLPKVIYAHGWWTFDKEKISKSRGKVINVDELISIAGVDSVRYFLLREASFGEDGDFSIESLVERHNNELANKLGNLVSRVSSLAEEYGIKKTKGSLIKQLNKKKIEKYFDSYELDKALSEIFRFIDICNEYTQKKKPWETGDKKVLFELVEALRKIAKLLYPFIPKTSEKISKIFKLDKIKKADILFSKIGQPINRKQNLNKEEEPKEIMEGVASAGEINFGDFEKLDLRVGEVQSIEEIKGADLLYKLTVSLGEEARTICAGIKEYYSHDDLRGKKVIVLANLKPRKLKGIMSHGMLLAAGSKEEHVCSLLTPDSDVKVGMKIS